MLYRLFGLPPIVYFILAPVVLALGVFMYVSSNEQDAQRAAALTHEAPAMIELADITSDESGNDYNEVVVRAQADPANMVEIVRTKRGSERGRKLFTPLYPADAENFSGPALAIMQIDGTVSDEQLGQFYLEDGPAGPILLLNGVLEGGKSGDVNKAFGDSVNLAPDVRTIEPFIDGREVALNRKGSGSMLLGLGFLLAALLAGFGYYRKRRLEKERAQFEAEYAEG